jgi:hypothetical protein
MNEIGFMKDKLLFLRTDFTSKDHSKNGQVPMAGFCRSSPVKMFDRVQLHKLLFDFGEKERVGIAFTISTFRKKSDDDFPPGGADIYLVFEVRLDGEKIKKYLG